jgi:hypothetical protein
MLSSLAHTFSSTVCLDALDGIRVGEELEYSQKRLTQNLFLEMI